MTDRILLNQDRLIISQEGYDASNPTLSNENKVFDSDWAFGGSIVASGIKEFTFQLPSATGEKAPDEIIDFPEQEDPPCVLLYPCQPADVPINPSPPINNYNPRKYVSTLGAWAVKYRVGSGSKYAAHVQITNSQIIIPGYPKNGIGFGDYIYRRDSTGNPSTQWYYHAYIYIVFGV